MSTVEEREAARHAAKTARENGLPQDCPYRNTGNEALQLIWCRVFAVTRAEMRQTRNISAETIPTGAKP